ncbi:dynamin family protein [Propionispira arboris]|nr:dynamin family protein [Propionispira arboris]
MNKTDLLHIIDKIKLLPYITEDMKEKYGLLLSEMERSMYEQELRIAVVGEFSSGKSTFLNALIGKDLFPHAVTETTATITYIHNVMPDDSRCNSMRVDFYDEKKEAITLDFADNQSILKDYLTTESKILNVAQDIQAVHVFCKVFPDNRNITIVDTPGLNGMAEGHRKITIEEISRAHASIYLFNIRGVSATELDVLKLLMVYQSHFIFVLNFIDHLNIDEGETAENKLCEFKKQLSQYGTNECISDKACFAISALYALVARDKSIKKLYKDDITEVTDEQREKLIIDSHMQNLETYLWNLAGENFATFLQQAVQSKVLLILKEMQDDINYYQMQRSIVNSENNKNAIQDQLVQRNSRFMTYQQNLQEYIQRECSSLQNALSDKVRKNIKDFEMEKKREINELQIENDEDIEAFVRNTNSAKQQMTVQYQYQVLNLLESVYQNSICKADAFVSKVQIQNNGDIAFQKMEEPQDVMTIRKKVDEYDAQINELGDKLDKEKAERNQLKRDVAKWRDAIPCKETEKNRAIAMTDIAIKQLSICPAIEEKPVTRYREKETHWYNPFSWAGGMETYTAYEKDSSKKSVWERKKAELEFVKKEKIRNFNYDIEELQSKIELTEQKINKADLIREYLYRIEHVETYKKEYLALQEKMQKQAHQEFLQSERKKIQEKIDDFTRLVGETLVQSIKLAVEENKNRICTDVLRHHGLLWETEVKRLNGLMNKYQKSNVTENGISLFKKQVELLIGIFHVGVE